jgi:hypothetical protein
MSVYTLDIDSSERDPVTFPNPGDYEIELKTPVYDVSKISLISARIHNSQLLIHERNNSFSINGVVVTLANNNYSGKTLAAELVAKIPVITSAVYDSTTNSITMNGSGPFTFEFYGGHNGYANPDNGYTTPHDILGLQASNVSSVGTTLTTGSINLQGPDALIVKLSSGSDEFNKTVFSETPFYTGRILLCGDATNFSGIDDAVEHYFHSGVQKTISRLRVQFFFSSNNRLIPYDFRNATHVLKLAINCSTDKLTTTTKVKKDFSLPAPIRIPEMEDPDRWAPIVYIIIITITGLIFLLLTKPRRSISGQ